MIDDFFRTPGLFWGWHDDAPYGDSLHALKPQCNHHRREKRDAFRSFCFAHSCGIERIRRQRLISWIARNTWSANEDEDLWRDVIWMERGIIHERLSSSLCTGLAYKNECDKGVVVFKPFCHFPPYGGTQHRTPVTTDTRCLVLKGWTRLYALVQHQPHQTMLWHERSWD